MTSTTLPASRLEGLELRDGDTITGKVTGDSVTITVLTATTREKADTTRFAERWQGKFSDRKEDIENDDPRAEYLLNR